MAPQIDNLESAYLTLKGFLDGNDDEALNIYVSLIMKRLVQEPSKVQDQDLCQQTWFVSLRP